MSRCICGAEIIPLMIDCIKCGSFYEKVLAIQQELTEENIEVEDGDSTMTIYITHDGINYRRVIEKRIPLEDFCNYVDRIVARLNGE